MENKEEKEEQVKVWTVRGYSCPFKMSLPRSLHPSITISVPVRPDAFLLYFPGKVSNATDRFVFPNRLLTPVWGSFKPFTGPFLRGIHMSRGRGVQSVVPT